MSEQYMAFAGAIFLLMVSPGPMVTQVMLDARRGWPWATVLGGVLSAQCLLALALWMLHWAWQVQPQLLLGVQIVGGGYLLWLGWRSWPAWSADAEPAPASSARGFWRAMALGLSNPKDIVFFLAFLPGFLQTDAPFAWQAFWLMAIWGVIDASVLSPSRRPPNKANAPKDSKAKGGPQCTDTVFSRMVAAHICRYAQGHCHQPEPPFHVPTCRPDRQNSATP